MKDAFTPRLSGSKQPASKTDRKAAGTPATLAQIRAACIGCDSEFAIAQLNHGASIEDAKTAYIGTLAAKLQNRDDQLADMRQSHRQEVQALATKHRQETAARDEQIATARMRLRNVRLGEIQKN